MSAVLVIFVGSGISAEPGRVPVPDVYIESTMVLELNDDLSPLPTLPNGKFTIDVRSWTCEGGSIVVFRSPETGPSEKTMGQVLPSATLAIVWPEGGLFQIMKLEESQYFILRVVDPRSLGSLEAALHPLVLQKMVRLAFEMDGGGLPNGAQESLNQDGTRRILWEQPSGGWEVTGAMNEFEVEMVEGLVKSYQLSRRTKEGVDLFMESTATPGAFEVADVPSRVESITYLEFPEKTLSRVTHTITKVERLPPGSTFEAIRARETAGMRVLPPGPSEEVLKWQAKYPSGGNTVAGSIKKIATSPRGWFALAVFLIGGTALFLWWGKLKPSGPAGAPRRPRAH